MGFEVVPPFVAYAAPRVSDAERQAYLEAWEARVLKIMSKPVTRADEDLATSLAAIGPAAWQRPAKGP